MLDTAGRRFAEHGYHTTSVSEIVRQVGVGKGVFYWYFESKEQLFLEVLAQAQTELRRAQDEAVGDEPDPVRRIERGIRGALTWLEANRDVLALFQLAATDVRFVGALRTGEEVMAAELAAHLKEGIVSGRIPDGDPLVLAHAVLGAIEALAHTFLGREGAWDDGVADTAVAFCLGGLLADRSATRRGGSGPS
ncbi:MAG: TetR family transcriptional regulator [Actinomycetia bacterium]|nr:TetR family transcriptional regulator [Actinomycetes bacterium]